MSAFRSAISNDMSQVQPITEELISEAKLYNRIYVASVHPNITEDELQSVFEPFGKIISCKLEPDPSLQGRHRSIGYIEYETAQSATDAVSSLNLVDLAGQCLRVGKATTPPKSKMPSASSTMPTAAAGFSPTASADESTSREVIPSPAVVIPPAPVSVEVAQPPAVGIQSVWTQQVAAALPPEVTGPSGVVVSAPGAPVSASTWDDSEAEERRKRREEEVQSLENQDNMQIKGRDARHMMTQKLMRTREPTVLILRNMVGPEDLDDDLAAEVTKECGRLGAKVEQVIIYQERQGEFEDSEIIVKIFVVFVDNSALERAVQSLNGRFFGGRAIVAEPYDQDLFNANDLSA